MERSPGLERLLERLHRFERAAVRLYRGFLWLVVAAIFTGAGVVIWMRPWGEGHQGEWFYFAVVVLIALGAVGAQFQWLAARERGGRGRSGTGR